MALPDKQIIIFDGYCNLCDSVVQFVIRHDKSDAFRFLPLQSALGRELTGRIGVDPAKVDSIILYSPGKAYFIKSDAALRIGKALGWRVASALLGLLPKSLRDFLYDYVARNRYRWFGRKDACLLPTPETRSKFLA